MVPAGGRIGSVPEAPTMGMKKRKLGATGLDANVTVVGAESVSPMLELMSSTAA
jgi:hypothetical protein